jgi:hypothetical protein
METWHIIGGLSMKILNPVVVFLLLIFLGCQDLGEPESSAPLDCNPPAHIDPRIVVGESIARLRIGDTRCDVVRKVGEPTRILDGDMNGEIYVYENAPLSYTLVFISDDPSLGLGVNGVQIAGDFGGLTHDGIGIKSERSFVVERLGMPDTTDGGPPLLYDSYFFTANTFVFAYENQRILRISMWGW